MDSGLIVQQLLLLVLPSLREADLTTAEDLLDNARKDVLFQ